MAEIRCPMCGRPNPDDRDDCQYCHARLKPVLAFPENPSPKPGTSSGDIPNWLEALRAAQGIVTGPLTPPANMPGPVPAEQPDQKAEEPAADLPAWSQEQTPDPEPAQPSPFESVDDVNDWLHRFDPPSPAQKGPEESEEEPDWLESIRRRSTAETSGIAAPAAPAGSNRSTPQPAPSSGESDWLQSLRQSPAKDEPPAAPPSSAPEDDWLARLGSTTFAAREEEPAAPAELPDWLRDVSDQPAGDNNTGAGSPFSAEGLTAKPSAAEIPDWMKSLEPYSPAPEPPTAQPELPPSPPPLSPPSAEFAEFLKNAARMDDPLPSSGFYAEPEPEQPEESSAGDDLPGWTTGPTPDWLAALEAKAGAPPSLNIDLPSVPPLIEQTSARPETPAAPVDPFVSGALPDWLGELGTAERSSDSPTQPGGIYSDAESPDVIESAELPSWVQALRPVETVAPKAPAPTTSPAETRVEDSGPLAGLRGILPAEPAVIPTRKAPAASTTLEINEVQQRHSQILENLLTSESQAEALPETPAISSQRILRLVIAAVMLVALLIPLLGGIQIVPPPVSAPAEVTALQSSLTALPASAPVLLVADYSPAVAGEMQAAASGPLTDLLLKGSRLTIISTSPTGPALADHLLSGLIPASDPQYEGYRNGEKVVHLGYLPGGATSLAAFAADPRSTAPFTLDNQYAWERPALAGVQSISDFARVIVMTENANTGQAWVEQIQPRLGSGASLLVIAGAQAAPSLRPYVDSQQVQGMVAGVAGGAAYESLIGRPGVGRVYWDAFQFGTWAAIIIILVGVAAVFFRPALAAIRKGESAE